MRVSAFPMVEKALKSLIEDRYVDSIGKIGGDQSYDGTDDFYVLISLVPGGSSDQNFGEWVLDVDVFAKSYAESMGRSLDLEACLVGARHATDLMIIDNIYQNISPSERPWDDESIFRIGATYVLTARRSG